MKGLYIASPFCTRLSKDTLIEYTCSPNCCVAPNVPVYFDTANKFRVMSSIVGYHRVFQISLTGKSKTQLL